MWCFGIVGNYNNNGVGSIVGSISDGEFNCISLGMNTPYIKVVV